MWTTRGSNNLWIYQISATYFWYFKNTWHFSPHRGLILCLKNVIKASSSCFKNSQFLQMFQMLFSCPGESLNVVSAECLVVETSLDRLNVWEMSVKSGVGVCREGGLRVFVLKILCKHVFLWVCVCNYGLPSLFLSFSLCLSFYLGHYDILSSSYCPCKFKTVYTTSPFFVLPSSAAGPSQGLSEGLRHEAAQQVWDDQAVRLCLLLGGEAHHGIFQQPLGCSGVHIHQLYSVSKTKYVTKPKDFTFKHKTRMHI